MSKEINLEEIMHDHVDPHCFIKKGCYEGVIDAMREACKQTLELAADNAKTEDFYIKKLPVESHVGIRINKQSILDTINLVK